MENHRLRGGLFYGIMGAALALSAGGKDWDRYGLFEPQDHGRKRARQNMGQKAAAKVNRVKARRRRERSR